MEGYCRFIVVECFLESCGEFESVVEFVDGDSRYTTLYTFSVGMSRAIMVNYARFIRDIHRDTFEIWEIHARLTTADLLGLLLVQVALSIV